MPQNGIRGCEKKNRKFYPSAEPESTLALLVARIGTDHANDPIATDHLAFATNALY
jgi:hypothetical protein